MSLTRYARLGGLFPWRKAALLAIVLSAGCDTPNNSTGAGGASTPKIESRETIRKYTQNVLKLQDALAQGGQVAQAGGETGPSGGYLGTVAKAYRSSVATIAMQQVQQMMQIYDIQNNGPLKTYEEFMEFIIKKDQPDGMQLPMLPYYQEYAFDENSKQLVVVEFPEKKKQYEEQHKNP